MTKYLIKRLIHGILSIIVVVAIIMLLVYTLMNRDQIFAKDSVYSHMSNNNKIVYKYQLWEQYGYLDYVPYAEWLQDKATSGELDEETRTRAVNIGRTADKDNDVAKQYLSEFTEYYESEGYTVVRLDAIMLSPQKVADGGQQQVFAYRDLNIFKRLGSYLVNLVTVDDLDNAKGIDDADRGLSFTWHDPAYGGDKFSPAVMGNGTTHKYLLYCDSKFPFIHQNIFEVHLGTSYSVNQGVDVFETMTETQGSYVKSLITYPTGVQEERADDLHSATYIKGSRDSSEINSARFTDDYTNVKTIKSGHSKMGYSFIIGIIEVILAYLCGVPLGITMARHKDGVADKIGTAFIVFMIAVPSLAYIFLFKQLGGKFGLPTTFNMDEVGIKRFLVYVLPILSLGLQTLANLVRWLRRYMIDQMNSDYVKFARSGGLTENEIFRNHILKNAAIPIIHDIPSYVLFAMVGAIVTEAVYVVPGAGNLLTQAINAYDNGVIVGVALFYAILTVLSLILGDILMALVDPRISFDTKDR